MLFFLIKTFRKKAAVVVTCLALITAVYQAQISAQVFYTDQVRYNDDVHFAGELNKLITQAQPEDKQLPVALIGKYFTVSRFQENSFFLDGEIIGSSVFTGHGRQTTLPGLAFMKSLGYNFERASDDQINRAFMEAVMMPPYPDPECVKRVDDFIVVRISEQLY